MRSKAPRAPRDVEGWAAASGEEGVVYGALGGHTRMEQVREMPLSAGPVRAAALACGRTRVRASRMVRVMGDLRW